MWLHPKTVVETSGAATRTTTTEYDAAERADLVDRRPRPGWPGPRPGPGRSPVTVPTTGSSTTPAASTRPGPTPRLHGPAPSTTYDRWGRPASTVGDAGTVTTTYDAAGRVATVTDAKGTTTLQLRRHRTSGAGLLTCQTITRAGTAGTLTYGAAYDATAT